MGSFGGIVTTILVGAVTIGGVLMSTAAQEAHRFACLIFLLADFFAAICFVVWFKQRTGWDGMAITKAVCLAGFILAGMPAAIYYSWNSADAQPAQNISGNQGIITNSQSGGSNTVNNYGPVDRSLTPAQTLAITESLHGAQTPVFLVSLEDPEAKAYATQVLAAIRESGVIASTLEIGETIPAQYGVTLYPNGNDAGALESALRAANITFSIDYSSSVLSYQLSQHKDCVGLLIGLRDD